MPSLRPLWLVSGALALAQGPVISAHAGATGQTPISAHVVGTRTIHGGPASLSVVSSPEIRDGGDDLSVKVQTPGGAAGALRAALRAKYGRVHALPIPSRYGPHSESSSQAADAPAWGLPPPPTDNPNPAGRKVKDVSASTFGFNGLNHFDQRFAGTGAYLNTQFSLEPPDQGLCAGNGFVVETINDAIAVYDTSGNALTGAEALNQFWGLAPEINRVTGVTGPEVSDPRCAYDRQSGHWFVTELMLDNGTNVGATGRSYNLIAVSKTADPRGGFVVISYDVTDDGLNGTPSHPGCPCYGDQPLLGFDRYGVYQSTNEFGAAFNGSQIYALSKAGLIAAANGSVAPIVGVAINAGALPAPSGGTWYSIQPAIGSGGDSGGNDGSGTEFFLSALQFGAPPYQVLDNRIAVWALTNTHSLSGGTPELDLSFQVIASETYGQPNPAQQNKHGPTPLGDSLGDSLEYIDTNDDRMNQVVYANGLLYSAVNTIIGNGKRTGIAWFAVAPQVQQGNVSGRVVRQGYVAVDGENVIFPSIGVTGEGSGLMVFTLVGKGYFPSAAYVNLGDDSGEVRIVANGVGPDDGFTGYPQFTGTNVARWGDYSAAAVDGSNIWLATEYIGQSCTDAEYSVDTTCGGTRSTFANWGTWIAMKRADD
jgi:hypothetical protein